uniref:Uncharacterized protein n=1 Tax=Romanomermis culicivorax TaxID=13658 RepID=A0A915IZL0_ROMCU
MKNARQVEIYGKYANKPLITYISSVYSIIDPIEDHYAGGAAADQRPSFQVPFRSTEFSGTDAAIKSAGDDGSKLPLETNWQHTFMRLRGKTDGSMPYFVQLQLIKSCIFNSVCFSIVKHYHIKKVARRVHVYQKIMRRTRYLLNYIYIAAGSEYLRRFLKQHQLKRSARYAMKIGLKMSLKKRIIYKTKSTKQT